MPPSPSALDSPSAESLSPEVLDAAEPLDASLVSASQPFVGQWNRLVSTTNWRKGRIIVEWRQSLIAQGVAVSEYSDEAWARLVGGVTGQHVGRLRRVCQRFGETHEQFPGLFWSHFQAALDWADAEMWLEGAVASGWSVAQMRDQRWLALGQVEADRPQASDVVAAETDEDFEPARTAPLAGQYADVQAGPRLDGPDFGDDEPRDSGEKNSPADREVALPAVELVRPFEDLPELPDDLAEAFEAMKLAILRHKTAGFADIAAADILRSLDALKTLVTAPSANAAPF